MSQKVQFFEVLKRPKHSTFLVASNSSLYDQVPEAAYKNIPKEETKLLKQGVEYTRMSLNKISKPMEENLDSFL